MSSIKHAFHARLDRLRSEFNQRKAAFAEAIKADAVHAIEDHAEEVAELQHEIEAFDYAHGFLAEVGSTYKNSSDAIEAAIDSLTQHIVLCATDGKYSSGICNAMLCAECVGTRDAITQLEHINNHPAA